MANRSYFLVDDKMFKKKQNELKIHSPLYGIIDNRYSGFNIRYTLNTMFMTSISRFKSPAQLQLLFYSKYDSIHTMMFK